MRWVSGSCISPRAPVRVGPRGVEIAEGDEAQAVGPVEVREDAFDHRLGRAVGVEGLERMVFGDGLDPGDAVDGRARGKDESPDPGLEHGLQEVQGRAEVVAVVFPRVPIGFPDLDEGGEMEDGRDVPVLPEDAPRTASLSRRSPTTRRLPGRRDPGFPVERSSKTTVSKPPAKEGLDRVGADVARSARDEDLHARPRRASFRAALSPPARVSNSLSSCIA